MEESNPTAEALAKMMEMMQGLSARVEALAAENKELKSARDAEKDLVQATPVQSSPWSLNHPRTAVSVVLSTRPVMDDPHNPAWEGKVAGTTGRGKE